MGPPRLSGVHKPLPPLRGMDLLDTPLLNKGTAFTEEEREAFGLSGLLPPYVESLDEQVTRAYEAFRRKSDDLERYIYLRALQDRNEVLFYRLLLDHMEEMIPVVYTPVVALGCQEFSHIYRRPRGLFIPYPLRDSIPTLLAHRSNHEVDVIVVTDGERILGIGDQGVGGLGIPIGKLSLYTIIGGIRPDRTLPIILDAGTNNVERLKDPEYLGWRHERVVGPEYRRLHRPIRSCGSAGAPRDPGPVGGLRCEPCAHDPRTLSRSTSDVQRRHPGNGSRRSRDGSLCAPSERGPSAGPTSGLLWRRVGLGRGRRRPPGGDGGGGRPGRDRAFPVPTR